MLEELTSLTDLLLIVSLLVNVITLLIVLRLRSSVRMKDKQVPASNTTIVKPEQTDAEVGVVFCRNCGNQYESTKKECPSCRTLR